MRPDNRPNGDGDVTYEVRYTEPDGTQEVDTWDTRDMADHWAEWCREDGCTDVEVVTVVD